MKFKNPLTLTTLTFIVVVAATLNYEANSTGNIEAKREVQTNKTKYKQPPTNNNMLAVTVSSVREEDYRSTIKGYGEVVPVHNIGLTSEIAGHVIGLSTSFKTGLTVSKGEVIAQIDKTNYRQALANAQSSLEEAKIALLEEERKSIQAKNEWERSGVVGQPVSELVLRKPQLAFAHAQLASAKADVERARRDLDNTLIRAPFNALVVTRDIQPGSVIQPGTQIATLYSTDTVEVSIPLSSDQWEQLLMGSKEIEDQIVEITSSVGKEKWEGKIDRIEKHLSQDTRQRAIVVSVDRPFNYKTELFPGTFVQVQIKGNLVPNLWALPSSTISQDGNIWFVSAKMQLNSVKVNSIFNAENTSYIHPVHTSDIPITRIVTHPLSHFEEGMTVKIRDEHIL